MLKKAIGAAALATLVFAVPAFADPVMYTWTGPGINTQGSTKCPGYKMTIDVTVDGTKVKGRFQQEGRPERHFETTLDAKGMIKTKAELGQGNTIEVSGTITDSVQKVLLDGYCKFDAAKMTKK